MAHSPLVFAAERSLGIFFVFMMMVMMPRGCVRTALTVASGQDTEPVSQRRKDEIQIFPAGLRASRHVDDEGLFPDAGDLAAQHGPGRDLK